jgi:hypothetical protein
MYILDKHVTMEKNTRMYKLNKHVTMRPLALLACLAFGLKIYQRTYAHVKIASDILKQMLLHVARQLA